VRTHDGAVGPSIAGSSGLVGPIDLCAMDPNITALERAFQLARSGRYGSIGDIRKRLSDEGYAGYLIRGPVLMAQLRALIREARAASHTGSV
jgi:hypothetical protein